MSDLNQFQCIEDFTEPEQLREACNLILQKPWEDDHPWYEQLTGILRDQVYELRVLCRGKAQWKAFSVFAVVTGYTLLNGQKCPPHAEIIAFIEDQTAYVAKIVKPDSRATFYEILGASLEKEHPWPLEVPTLSQEQTQVLDFFNQWIDRKEKQNRPLYAKGAVTNILKNWRLWLVERVCDQFFSSDTLQIQVSKYRADYPKPEVVKELLSSCLEIPGHGEAVEIDVRRDQSAMHRFESTIKWRRDTIAQCLAISPLFVWFLANIYLLMGCTELFWIALAMNLLLVAICLYALVGALKFSSSYIEVRAIITAKWLTYLTGHPRVKVIEPAAMSTGV